MNVSPATNSSLTAFAAVCQKVRRRSRSQAVLSLAHRMNRFASGGLAVATGTTSAAAETFLADSAVLRDRDDHEPRPTTLRPGAVPSRRFPRPIQRRELRSSLARERVPRASRDELSSFCHLFGECRDGEPAWSARSARPESSILNACRVPVPVRCPSVPPCPRQRSCSRTALVPRRLEAAPPRACAAGADAIASQSHQWFAAPLVFSSTHLPRLRVEDLVLAGESGAVVVADAREHLPLVRVRVADEPVERVLALHRVDVPHQHARRPLNLRLRDRARSRCSAPWPCGSAAGRAGELRHLVLAVPAVDDQL
jgi:hypothetical protein